MQQEKQHSATEKINALLGKMWIDYCDLNPAARKIYDLLTRQGEKVTNDHIALRTFNHPLLGLESMAKVFKNYGYIEKGDYIFKEKKLFAKHYENQIDPSLPKIFISELELEKCSPFIQKTIDQIVTQIPKSTIDSDEFTLSGRSWNLDHKTYLKLAAESEYASWVSAIGFRPNHFTVFVNPLKKFADLKVLNQFIKDSGYKLNASGGEIKGDESVFLAQSSTMAEEVSVSFNEGKFKIPGCYYEFAKRYALPNGQLYQGFVATSADKIFESTDRIK